MKMRIWQTLLLVGLVAACTQQPATEESAPNDTTAAVTDENPTRGLAKAEIGDARVEIDYGRPALEGRDMLSRLPDGEVWRLGMDAATSLKATAPLAFGATTLDAGSYSLFVRKISADEWILLVNSQTGIWGTAYNGEFDVAEIPLEKTEASGSVERFTVDVNPGEGSKGELVFEWGNLRLRTDFEVQPTG